MRGKFIFLIIDNMEHSKIFGFYFHFYHRIGSALLEYLFGDILCNLQISAHHFLNGNN